MSLTRSLMTQIKFEIRVPPIIEGSTQAKPMANFRPLESLGWRASFLDDTGSDVVTIFDDDLDEILNLTPSGTQVPTIGVFALHTAGGKSNIHRNIVLQARVLGPSEQPITNFYPVRVVVWPSSYRVDVPVRLSGNWWRHVLYVASAPANNGRLYASTMKQDLGKALPDVDFQQAKEPLKAHIRQSEKSGLSDETGMPDWLKGSGGTFSGFHTSLGYGRAGTPMRPLPTQPSGQASEINPVPPRVLSEYLTQLYPSPVPPVPSSAAPSRATGLRNHSSVASGPHPSPYQGQNPGLTQGAFSPGAVGFGPVLRLDPKASIFAPRIEQPPSNPVRSPMQPEYTGVRAEMHKLALESRKRARASSGQSEWFDQGFDAAGSTRSSGKPTNSGTGQKEGPAPPQRPKPTRRPRRNKSVQIDD
jgi:hypothetical protein